MKKIRIFVGQNPPTEIPTDNACPWVSMVFIEVLPNLRCHLNRSCFPCAHYPSADIDYLLLHWLTHIWLIHFALNVTHFGTRLFALKKRVFRILHCAVAPFMRIELPVSLNTPPSSMTSTLPASCWFVITHTESESWWMCFYINTFPSSPVCVQVNDLIWV